MADEVEQTEETIWERLGIPAPDESEPYEELAEEAEAEAEEEDKLARKISSKVDDLQKKFDRQMLEQRRDKFLEKADPVERDLFKAIAGDVKDPASLDHAIELVAAKAKAMKEQMERYEEQMKAEAAKAWGVTPGKASGGIEQDELDKIEARAKAGDTSAMFKLFNAAPASGTVSPLEK